MKLDELEKMADEAITEWNTRLFKLSGSPSVQFVSPRIIPELLPGLVPRLLGQTRRGDYCYLVDANNLKQAIFYFKSEFANA